MNKRITPAIAMVIFASAAFSSPSLAADAVKPTPAVTAPDPQVPLDYHITGQLEYRDIEGGYYAVGEWALMGDAKLFADNLGKQVIIYGRPFDGATAQGVKSFVVSELVVSVPPGKESVTADPVGEGEWTTLTGVVERTEIEGGFYSVDGYALMGDEQRLASLVGKQVVVHGKLETGPSIYMVPRVVVESISREADPQRTLPPQVLVGGKVATFDQGPEVVDGTLMIPLRAVVETAGGTVEWDQATQAVHVEMADRQAFVWVGQDKAEMNLNYARYLTRNMLAMRKAPLIKNGRVLVSADSLTHVLGLYEMVGSDSNLHLSVKP